MLSANARAASLKPDPLRSNGFDAVWRAIGRLLLGIVRRGPRCAPDLPDELSGDVGFRNSQPFDRESAFWEARRRSVARDLPF